MLSNLVITPQCFVLIIDELQKEKHALKIPNKLLCEQGETNLTTKILPLNSDLKDIGTLSKFAKECAEGEASTKWNVLLPPLSDLLCFQPLATLFKFIQKLRETERVQRVFLCLTPGLVIHPQPEYVVAAFEYMADLVLRFHTATQLSITTRKSGGSITNKSYKYTYQQGKYYIESLKPEEKLADSNTATNSETIGATFKIELEEEELQARNAMKLPYEKASEDKEGVIIYKPDLTDDYDEEDDLDDDLCI